MEERSLRVLEFNRFLRLFKEYATSEVGQSLSLALRPTINKVEVEHLLQEVAEARDMFQVAGDIPVAGLKEIRPLLSRIQVEGTCLLPEEFLLLRSTVEAAGRVKQFLRKMDSRYPLLREKRERIPELRFLQEKLQAALGARGEILDTASLEIKRLRQEISRARARIRQALEGLWEQESLKTIFQDQIVTLRNERYVVAVKSEFKNALPGIIHDQSQSRATYFIEPLATVDENNELNLLLKDEREEEQRILLRLTSLIRENSEDLAQAVEILGYLDLLLAKAKYARVTKGTIPLLNEDGHWRLPQARHPLIDSHSVVPVNLYLEEGKNTLIISGANAGGKTVALKTLGLLNLMAQCGIPIPAAEGSEVAVFEDIFADIGDEQSLQDNLSTFSAWIQSTARIIKGVGPSSLVLLDEVGGGTDPTEGAALTMALIDRLRESGAKTVVTTHLHLLKAYGAANQDVVNVSVEFDAATLRPTYRLIYGRPGESYALPMAEKWGFPPELVAKAKTYLGEGDRRVMELFQSLEQTQQKMEAKREEWEGLRKEAEAAREEARALSQQTQKEKEIILTQTREETQALITKAREDLRQLINDFKAQGRTDVHRLAKEITTKEEEVKRSFLAERTELHPRKEVRIGQQSRAKAINYQIPEAARELNVIGLRVEEALPIMDKTIDEAFLAGLKELEVIHGAGTGRLRQAIRHHLKGHVLVKGFIPGGPGRGGDGVTVVEIGPQPGARASNRRPGRERLGRN